jgi:lantibiotic transport system ATP-binding protein
MGIDLPSWDADLSPEYKDHSHSAFSSSLPVYRSQFSALSSQLSALSSLLLALSPSSEPATFPDVPRTPVRQSNNHFSHIPDIIPLMPIVETRGLTFSFTRGEPVLTNLNLGISKGTIYGFLGPNGAGKTTTLRLLLGLLRNQQGEIFLFGKPFSANRIEILKNIGSMIETPSLYGHLTARENLELLRNIYRSPKQRIDYVLKLTGLHDTRSKKTSEFSLGMKQRLGIAVALLHEPLLLMLDEPTNGLDPNGIIEIRELLRTLNTELGITVLISSHILPEIEKLVTHLGIIHHGHLIFQGTIGELRDRYTKSVTVVLDTTDPKGAMAAIASRVTGAELRENRIILRSVTRDQIPAINKLVVDAGVGVYEIRTAADDLESIFIDLIGK